MVQVTLCVGTDAFVPSDPPNGRWSCVFEDDGETGYFYACDLQRPNKNILDAVHVYNVSNVVDRDLLSTVQIVWSTDGSKCALLINQYAHAVFDFIAKRGHCRTNFPNFPENPDSDWLAADHAWSDEAASWIQARS